MGTATRSFGKRGLGEAADAEIATIPGSNSLKVTKPQFERNGAMMRTEPLCGLDIYPLTLARLPFLKIGNSLTILMSIFVIEPTHCVCK